MFRLVCSSSLRAAPLVRTRVAPRTALFVRTVVTKRFTKEHEWVSYDSDTKIGTVSITDHAQQQLGDVVFVELPSVGSVVEFEKPIGAVESVKAASDINAPVSGEVKEINAVVNENPGLLNSSPEDEGNAGYAKSRCRTRQRQVVLQPQTPILTFAQLDKLLTEEEYKAFCNKGE
ncbi:glycine cleavage system H protein, mitochondrial [Ceratobasidium sp. AG-Ba]|nr:glycine cleavage system H protein, mitochondrial [Ceratobasidium sp. AG-Ba]